MVFSTVGFPLSGFRFSTRKRYRIGATCCRRRLSRRASILAAGARKKTDPGRPVQLLGCVGSVGSIRTIGENLRSKVQPLPKICHAAFTLLAKQ